MSGGALPVVLINRPNKSNKPEEKNTRDEQTALWLATHYKCWSNSRIPRHFEAVSLKELDMWIGYADT